jgi:hypothetical protein
MWKWKILDFQISTFPNFHISKFLNILVAG